MSNSSEKQSVPPGAYAVTFGIAAYIVYKLNMKTAALIFFIIAILCLIAQLSVNSKNEADVSLRSFSDTPDDSHVSSESVSFSSPASSSIISDAAPSNVPSPKPQDIPSALPESIRGHVIANRYTDVGIYVPKDATFDAEGFVPGAPLSLYQDKENKHDPNAIGLRLNKRRIGYLYRGKLQDMANDWISKGLPMRAVLTKTEREDNRAEVTLAFYDLSDYKKLRRRYPGAKEYRLTYNLNSEMQDNLQVCSKGEECDISYDIDRGRYLISSGLDIGYLPASAEKLIEQYGEDSCRVFISDLYTNDNDKTVATVYVFPK